MDESNAISNDEVIITDRLIEFVDSYLDDDYEEVPKAFSGWEIPCRDYSRICNPLSDIVFLE